jgi:hypothetical protein
VTTRSHVGYLGAPGTMRGPRAVASSPLHIVVSAWWDLTCGDHVVHMFHAGSRAPLRILAGAGGPASGQLKCPMGLRLSADGTAVVVADSGNDRVCRWVGVHRLCGHE